MGRSSLVALHPCSLVACCLNHIQAKENSDVSQLLGGAESGELLETGRSRDFSEPRSRLKSQHPGRPRRVGHLKLGVQDHPVQYGETPSLLKIQKISWAWWHVPVIQATQEAEAGELLEHRRRRLW